MVFLSRFIVFLLLLFIFLLFGNFCCAKESRASLGDISEKGTELSLVLKIRENGNALDLDLGILMESLQIVSSYHIDRKNLDHKKAVSGMVIGLLRSLNGKQREKLLEISRKDPYKDEFDGEHLSLKVTSDDGITIKMDASYLLWSLQLAVKQGIVGNKKSSNRLAEYITKGFVQSLDRHSDYLNMKETEDYVSGFEVDNTVSLRKTSFEGKTVYIFNITEFSRNTGTEFKRLIPRNIKGKSAYVIFDLRNCPGGLDSSTEEMLGYILGPDKILLSECDYLDETTIKKSKASDGPGVGLFWKVACLVNKNTASNAEVVAACLRDNLGAKLFGSSTYGKGVGGTIVELPSGKGTCRITYVKWFTPFGKCVEGDGLKPDVLVSDRKKRGRDVVVETAIEDLFK